MQHLLESEEWNKKNVSELLSWTCLTITDGAIGAADLHSPEGQSVVGFLSLLRA